MDVVYAADPTKLIKKCSEKLKELKSIAPPSWANVVKTGAGRERPPIEQDWWYIRCASVLRKVYMLGPIGVSKLRAHYGNRKNRGMKPEKFYKASGNHIRKMLQQLEAEGLVEIVKDGIHKGRKISPKGQSFLRDIAREVLKSEEEKKGEKKGIKAKEEKTEKMGERKKEKEVSREEKKGKEAKKTSMKTKKGDSKKKKENDRKEEVKDGKRKNKHKKEKTS